MVKHLLKAEIRTALGRRAKTLRSQGLVPASLFGKNIASQNLTLNTKDFQKLYTQVGESGLVYLQLPHTKGEIPVIFSEVSTHPVTDQLLHISLRHVSLTEKIKAPVKIELTGKSPAVTDGLGVLVQQVDEIELEALPQDFPENITLDVSGLTEVDAAISVSELKLRSQLTVITDPQTILVKIDPLAKEEVVVAPVTPEVSAASAPESTPPAPESPSATSDKK